MAKRTEALPRQAPAVVALPITVLAALSAMTESSWADPQGLSANIPVRIKDAFDSGQSGDVGLYLTERYTQDSKGRYSLTGGPKFKFGLAPGLAVNLLPLNEVGDTRSSRGGFGAAAVEYQLNDQTAYLPAILLEGAYRQPYSGSNSSEYHLIGVATKFLGPSKQSPRLDLELNWGHVTHPVPGERRDRLSVGVAYSHLLTTRTAVVVDVVRQDQHFAGEDESFVDVGINDELSDAVLLGVGAGAGITQQGTAFRVFLGLKWTTHLF